MLNKLIATIKQRGALQTLSKCFRVLARGSGLTTREQTECLQNQLNILRQDFLHLKERTIQISTGVDFIAEWHAQHAAQLHSSTTPLNTLISIVMPTYNRSTLIENAIKSVLQQTYSNWELLIVDDGSIDNTAEIIKPYLTDKRIHYIPCSHRGVCATRNTGLEHSRGEIITYLDTDNIWYSHYLNSVAYNFAHHPGHETLYMAYLVEDHVSQHHKIVFMPHYNFDTHLNHIDIDISVFAHRRSLYQKLGGFDEQLRRYTDLDFILRYASSSRPLAVPLIGERYFRGSWERISNTEDAQANINIIRQKYSTLTRHATKEPV